MYEILIETNQVSLAFLGSVIGAAAGLLGGKSSDKASAKEAEKSRQYTTEQMQNRHQWEVEDLKKAGLNPILSSGGTPSIGSSAQATVTDKSKNMAEGTSAAINAMLAKEQVKNVKADTQLKKDTATASLMNAESQKVASSAQAAQNVSQAKLNQTIDTQKGKFTSVYDSIGKGAEWFTDQTKGMIDKGRAWLNNSAKENSSKSTAKPNWTRDDKGREYMFGTKGK